MGSLTKGNNLVSEIQTNLTSLEPKSREALRQALATVARTCWQGLDWFLLSQKYLFLSYLRNTSGMKPN